MNALNHLLATLNVVANVYHNGQYCGMWALDTSGSRTMSFHIVSKGQCYVRVGDALLTLNTGDTIFFPSDASHRVSNAKYSDIPVNMAESRPMTIDLEEDTTGLVCGNFGHDHPLFMRLLKQLPDHILIRADQNQASQSIVQLMLTEAKNIDDNTSLLLNRLADCLFYVLLRDHLDTTTGIFVALNHPHLSKALDLIHNHTDKNFTLDELAAAAAMSRSAFSSTFKSIVLQSPIEYVTQWRMTQAYRWLADEGISTLSAALRCGYDNEASFSKAFKRIIGIGPGQARNGSKILSE